jgi:hypothetical protein
MKRVLLVVLCLAIFGCATYPTTIDPTTDKANSFISGSEWVLAVTDGIVLTGCAAGKLKPIYCTTYAEARSLLATRLATISALVQGKASPVDIQAAISEAMLAYIKIEAYYKGQV